MLAPTLLIIDGAEIIRKRLQEMLTSSFPHYNILSAKNCKEGLATFTLHQPQIVVLDLNTDGCNGLKFLPKLLSINSQTKIIIASSHPTKNYRKASIDAGAYDFFDKSTDIEDLFKSIHDIHLSI